MKKTMLFAALAVMILTASCGNSKAKQEAAEKARLDSIAAVEAKQAYADSVRAAFVADSLKLREAFVADSLAMAEAAAKKVAPTKAAVKKAAVKPAAPAVKKEEPKKEEVPAVVEEEVKTLKQLKDEAKEEKAREKRRKMGFED